MKSILLAEDNDVLRFKLTDSLQTRDKTYKILAASNGEEAIQLLKAHPVDLLITDLKMPGVDGFALVAFMTREYPQTPIIVITAFGTPEIEQKMRKLGVVRYMEKPLDFDLLLENVERTLKSLSSGYVKGIALPSFLQMMEMEGKTCTLTVKSNENSGCLYFKNGVLLDGMCSGMEGEAAVYEILSWEKDVEIEIEDKCKCNGGKIKNPLNAILINGLRQKDELGNNGTVASPDGAVADVEDKVAVDDAGGTFRGDSSGNSIDDSVEKKESKMNTKKLKEAIEQLQEDLGGGLLATDIFTVEDGQSIAGFNSQPKGCALFTQITESLEKALTGSGFPGLGGYYLLNLVGKKMVIVIPLGAYQWGILIDSSKTKLGLLINIALPRCIDAFEEAIAMEK